MIKMKYAALANAEERTSQQNSPEKRLWQTVLLAAARDVENRPNRRREQSDRDNMDWVRSRDFNEVCDLAGVNVEMARCRFNEMING